MAGMAIEELVLAYELRTEGCSWKRIAAGLGQDPVYLESAVRNAKSRGIHSRLSGFGVDRALRRYNKRVLEAARLHRAVGMTWAQIALELTGNGDLDTARSLRRSVDYALKSGYIGNKPHPAANDATVEEEWKPTPSRWTAGGYRIRN